MINLAEMTKHIRVTMKRNGIKCNVSKTTTGSMRGTVTVSRNPNLGTFTAAEYRTISGVFKNNQFTLVMGGEIDPELFSEHDDNSEVCNQFNFTYPF